MILPIYIYGQPVLRKESADIEKDYPNLKELLANMFETMEEANGVGLAAPQITYIMHALKEKGMDVPTDATTIEEAADGIMKALKKERAAK